MVIAGFKSKGGWLKKLKGFQKKKKKKYIYIYIYQLITII